MSEYIFVENDADREFKRLRLLEAACDDASKSLLRKAGVGPGAACLELGAGAGSIFRWMGEQTGSAGTVCAVERDPRHIAHLRVKPYDVRAGDALAMDGLGPFDLAHARYVLVHNKSAEEVLARLVAWTRPGGRLALEEPDFTSARDVTGGSEAHARVNRAMWAMFTQGGLDPSFGARLPALVEKMGLRILELSPDMHLCAGGSPIAQVMAESAGALAARYQATGLASKDDVALYRRNAADPAHWAVYYSTVRLIAEKI